VASGSGHAPDGVGFAHSVSVCPPSSPGIFAALSTATTSAPPPGNARCNSVGAPAEDENAARIFSADNAASVAGVPAFSAA
jgi:hypothetical protein